MPTRWIDQGATDAIVFARVPNRYTAGLVEVQHEREDGHTSVLGCHVRASLQLSPISVG